MSTPRDIPPDVTHQVRDECLCLHAQRYARAIARRFDLAFRPLQLTNGQFSLLMALNRPGPAPMAPVAALLGLDRTTLTAALKPLEKRGLVEVMNAPSDRRGRLLQLTPTGRALLTQALPIWRKTHAEIEARLGINPDRFRKVLRTLD